MGTMIRVGAEQVERREAEWLAAVTRVVPAAAVAAVAAAHTRPGQRERKLPVSTLLLLVIYMSIFTQDALERVFLRMVEGLRLRCAAPAALRVSKSAIAQGRARLGVRPVQALFRQVARPLTTAATPGAYQWGLHLVALDGTLDVVPDTPANARGFGRPSGARGDGAYPQVLGVHLVEVGSHAILDATFWPCRCSEHHAARRLLRSLRAGMLLLLDRGFYSYAFVRLVCAQGVHLLACVPQRITLRDAHLLADGSQVGWLYPPPAAGRTATRLALRLITYRLRGPQGGQHWETRSLLTSLLDPQRYPARALVLLYHERWEVEVTFDELACHQRLSQRPLRSQTPQGVLQELYGLVLVHYALRATMLEAAHRRGVDPDRLSFTRTLQLVQAALPVLLVLPTASRPARLQLLLEDIAAQILPRRDHRLNPRVIKRFCSKFARKRAQHTGPPPRLRLPDAIEVLPPLTSSPLPACTLI